RIDVLIVKLSLLAGIGNSLNAITPRCHCGMWGVIPRPDAGARYACLLKLSLLHSRFVFSDPDPIKHLRPEQYRARKQAAVDRSAVQPLARGTVPVYQLRRSYEDSRVSR